MKIATFLYILFFFILLNSCTQENSNCFSDTCDNGGLCINGDCFCPEGFLGENCEIFDASKIQLLLDQGRTPKEILDNGIPIDSFYGKSYQQGLIFYLTPDGTGMVASETTISYGAEFGCHGINISGIPDVQDCIDDCSYPEPEDIVIGARIGDGKTNTDAILAECDEQNTAARLCRNLGEDWFLPSRGELYAMLINLHLNGHGNFSINFSHWSSTEQIPNQSWVVSFNFGSNNSLSKFNELRVRAAKEF